MTPYLITYDIEDDRQRKKVADRLLQAGLERVQYSVFMGPLHERPAGSLKKWLAAKAEAFKGDNDSIILLRLGVAQVEKMTTFGTQKWEVAWLNGTQNTLFL